MVHGEGPRRATSLFPVSGFRPRKRENLERGYRHGRYGAVPDISPGELVRLMRLGQSDSEAAQSPGLGPTGSALD